MTHRIFKSRLNIPEDQVKLRVNDHIRELEQWTENMRLYEEEQKTPPAEEPQRVQFDTDEEYTAAYVKHGETLVQRRQKYPPPSAHPEIDEAVSRSERDGKKFFSPDYVVVDDLPPEVSDNSELGRLKQVYLSRVAHAEQTAIHQLIPPGKVRFHQLREHDILTQDLKRDNDILGQISEMEPEDKRLVGLKKSIQDPKRHERVRSKENTQFLNWFSNIRSKQSVIQRRAAEMMSEIEDLTEDNVHSWTLGSF